MKRSTLLWILCAVVAFTAAGLVAVQNGWSQGVFVAQASPTPDTYINTVQLAASTPLPIETIPSYQGVHIETTYTEEPPYSEYGYEVEADKNDIVAFYKAWFAQEGWHLQWEKATSSIDY